MCPRHIPFGHGPGGESPALVADQAAARQVRRDTTAAVLRQIPLLDAADDHYVDTYALMGAAASALPRVGEFHGGFRRLPAARQPDAPAGLAAALRGRLRTTRTRRCPNDWR